jgi:uridine phosphorylase
MPARLRPTAPIAAAAVLVGDPGRALMLAQELLEQPKMSNHARGLWGYTGKTASGAALSLQSTGMGGPSAGLVLADLAELGVRRAVRVGTCAGLRSDLSLGSLVLVSEAHVWPGPGDAPALPDRDLFEALAKELGDGALHGAVASLDTLPRPEHEAAPAVVADMQTATLFARAEELGVALAAILIVAELPSGERIEDKRSDLATKRAGNVAAAVLSG